MRTALIGWFASDRFLNLVQHTDTLERFEVQRIRACPRAVRRTVDARVPNKPLQTPARFRKWPGSPRNVMHNISPVMPSCIAAATFGKRPALRTRDASTTSCMLYGHRRSLRKRSCGSAHSTGSKRRSAASRPTSADEYLRHRRCHCSMT